MRRIGSRARRWVGSVVAGPAALLLLPLPAAADCDRPRRADKPGRVELVLDASGSMSEPDQSGTAKIEAARQGLRTVVDELPAAAQVGLRVYGSTDLAESDPRACRDSKLVVPVGKADKPALRQAIDDYRPVGWTPIAYALEQAARDLGSSGPRTIVLVSDGEETCDRDPADVARRLRAKGIDLRIDVVGFDVAGDTRRQLERIADAGGGVYYDVDDADEMADALNQTTLRPFRPFTVQGTPVEGTTTDLDPPEIGPGQYTDVIGGKADPNAAKHYVIPRTPGSTVHVGFTAWPPARGGPIGISDAAALTLSTPDGETCASTTALQSDAATRGLLADGITAQPEGPDDPCGLADRLILRIQRTHVAPEHGRLPFEFVVLEEPALASANGLPTPFEDDAVADRRRVPPTKPVRRVAAGASFADAAELEPGTWTDSVQPGEVLFYRVRADWGERPMISVRYGPSTEVGDALSGYVVTTVIAYGPLRQQVGEGYGTVSGTLIDERPEQIDVTLHPVRYRNREETGPSQGMAMAGDYYFAVAMDEVDGCRFQVPMRITVALEGTPGGEPEYAELQTESPESAADPDEAGEPSPGDEPAATDTGSDTGSDTSRYALAAAAAGTSGLALVAVAFLLHRHRRSSRV